MLDGKLDKDLIADTTICDMLVRVGRERVDVAVYSVVSDNTLIYRSFSSSNTASLLKAIEDTVYDNPLMLCDFRRAFMLIDTSCYTVIPSEIDDNDRAESVLKALNPLFDGIIERAETATRNAVIVYGIERELHSFIRRTFAGITVMPHILPLVRYFASKPGRGNTRRMICNFRRSALDIVVIDGNCLLQANTFAFRTPMDAVYYILASRASHNLDPHNDEVLLAGDRQIRETVTPVLRTYIARVMPAIFPPQMFRAGKESMKAPFDLIITPLCE